MKEFFYSSNPSIAGTLVLLSVLVSILAFTL